MSPHPAARRPQRRAFTLIELLIVLAIIGMLAGLLLTAVFPIFGSARVTQVTAEISSIEKAIQDFKLRLGGIEPPSFVVLVEDGPNWNTAPPAQLRPAARRTRAFMQRAWPDYGFGTVDINGDGDQTDVIVLQSTEAMLFFLGGNGILNTANPQPLGFSVNPVNPFATGGQRIGPFHEFDTSRLTDIDGDGYPEYRDPIPGQTLPYLYFSSYDGAGYRPWGDDTNGDMNIIGDADDEFLKQGAGGADLLDGLYVVNDGQWPQMSGGGGGRPVGNTAAEYVNPKSFQLISPGQDFDFGAGGTYIRGKGLALYSGGMDSYRLLDARRAEFDNITNFSGGVLGETTYQFGAVPP